MDLTRYTLPTYMRIVTYKTAYYSFYLPCACGLLIGGVGTTEALELTRSICVEMGQYFQVGGGKQAGRRAHNLESVLSCPAQNVVIPPSRERMHVYTPMCKR